MSRKPPKQQLQPATLTSYEDLIKAINLAVVQFVLYSSDHPLVTQALGNAFLTLDTTLKDKQEIIFGLVEDKLLVEDIVLDTASPMIARFFTYFKKLKIDNLTFYNGITEEELGFLLAVMAMREDAIEGQGGSGVLLPLDKIPHLKLERVHYERIGEDQMVVSVEEGEKIVKVPEKERVFSEKGEDLEDVKSKKESFYNIMTKYLKGGIEDLSSEVDEKKLLQELERNPKRTAGLLLEVGREVKNLQLVVERMGNWLVDLVQREGVSLKRDPSEIMAIFGRNIQEELLREGKSGEALDATEVLNTVVSQYVDKIKLNMIVTKFNASKKKSAEVLEKIVGGVVGTEEERDRLLPQISEQLKDSGLSEQEFNKGIERLKKIPLEKKKVEITEAELKRLYEFEKIVKENLMRKLMGEDKQGEDKLSLKEDVKIEKFFLRPDETVVVSKDGAGGEGQLRPDEVAVSKDDAQKSTLLKPDEKVISKDEKVGSGGGGGVEGAGEVVVSREELEKLRRTAQQAEQIITARVKGATGQLTTRNRELSEDLENTKSLIREFSSGVIVVDKEDKVMLANRAAEDLLGISKEDLLGKHILDQLKDEHLLALVKRKQETPLAGVELSTPEASTKDTVRASSAVVQDENGKTIGMLFVLTDATKQKELEKAKQNLISRVSAHLSGPVVNIQDSLLLLLNQTAGDLNDEQKRLLSLARENAEQLQRSLQEALALKEAKEGEIK